MAKKADVKMNTFKRIDENRIELEGVVYNNSHSKMIEVKNPDGSKILSIKVQGVYYYPSKVIESVTI